MLEGAAELGELCNLVCAVDHHEGPEVCELLRVECGLPWALVVQGYVGPEPFRSELLHQNPLHA